MRELFDIYKVDSSDSSTLLGTVHSFSMAVFEIELNAGFGAPGDYVIVNRQTGERTVLSFGSQPKSEASAMKKPTD
jgi:hypothetical protein